MNKEFKKAFDAIIEEKKLNADILIDAMQAALSSSYKKNFNEPADIRTEINTETGEIKVNKVTTVVEEIEDADTQISLEDARKIKEIEFKGNDNTSIETLKSITQLKSGEEYNKSKIDNAIQNIKNTTVFTNVYSVPHGQDKKTSNFINA